MECQDRSPRRGSRAAWTAWLAPALLIPGAAFAQLTTSVLATGQYQYNSNVFDLQRGFQTGPNDYSLADRYYAYGAGLNVSDQISQQNVFLHATDTEFRYDHFSQLTHDEYNLDAGWKWQLGSDFNGLIEATRSRTMVPFTEIISVTLSIETDQREQASAGFLITPEWRVDANGYTDREQEPLPGEPNLVFADSGGGLTLKFLGGGEWAGNLSAAYQRGDFQNATVFYGSSYNQWNGSVGATFAPSGQGAGISTFDAAIGWTDRSSALGDDNVSGTTGHLDYTRHLTGKTSVTLAVDRNVSTFVTNAGGDISTSGALSVAWQATYKIGVNLGYNLVYVNLPDQGLVPGTNRGDHLQFASLTVNYAALDWLAIRPYADYQTRTSNLYGANFNASIFGVSFVVQWPSVSAVSQPAISMPAAF